ncbi:MAG: hypothetical protein ACFN0J_08335, partial [Segatella salivae]
IGFILSLDCLQVVERMISSALLGRLMRFFLIVESTNSVLFFHKKIELSMLFNTGQLIFSIERICEKLFISLPFILICQWIAVNL